MKIDFDMLKQQVDAGMPAQALLIYFRTMFDAHQAKRVGKRPGDAKRSKARREREKGGPKRDDGVTPEDSGVTETPSQIAERELFARGKQLCGNRAGGLISRLLQHEGYDIGAARKIVDAAATKNDPREYIVGSMRSKNGSGNATMSAFDDLIARAEGGEVEDRPPMRDVTPRRA